MWFQVQFAGLGVSFPDPRWDGLWELMMVRSSAPSLCEVEMGQERLRVVDRITSCYMKASIAKEGIHQSRNQFAFNKHLIT